LDTTPLFDGSDPAFVLDPTSQPKRKHNDFVQTLDDKIPCVDLSPLYRKDPEGIKNLVCEIGKAAEDWGFFEVVNHDVPLSLFDTLDKLAMAFFSLPLKQKNGNSRNSEHPFGYFNEELTHSRKDWKEVFDFLVRDSVLFSSAKGSSKRRISSQWPQEPIDLG
jgi:isopenicillin N synthase-like dioxygenase